MTKRHITTILVSMIAKKAIDRISDEELDNINEGFTKVIFHDIGDTARNEYEFEIPHRVFELKLREDNGEYGGSKLGGKPCLLQNETLKLEK